MNKTLASNNAWETIHGPHIPAKQYVPPFMEATFGGAPPSQVDDRAEFESLVVESDEE